MSREELQQQLGELTDWCANCEQDDVLATATVNDIMDLVEQYVVAVIGEDVPLLPIQPREPEDRLKQIHEINKTLIDLNSLRAEQRQRAGINVHTNQQKDKL